MRQSVEVGSAQIHFRGSGWFLLGHDDVMQLKKNWPEIVKFDDLSTWAKSAPAELRGVVARRAALRLMPLAWILSDEELAGEKFSVVDQVLECLLTAHFNPQARGASEHVFRIFQGKLPYELADICVGVEEAFDAESSGGLRPYVVSTIDRSWARDATYTQKKHDLARMPEPEESNTFLAVCADIHCGASNSENLWNNCVPTEAWLDSVAAMQNSPKTHAVETYLTKFASPVIDALHGSVGLRSSRDQKPRDGYISRLLSKLTAKG